MISPIYIQIADARTLGFCIYGIRRYCTRYGINFQDLVRGKVPVEVIEATGESQAIKVATMARNRNVGR